MTKTTSWNEIFKPASDARGLSERPQQTKMGNAVIESFNTGKLLVAECPTGTGKSFVGLVSMVVGILEGKKKKISRRGVVSTETNSLLDQYILKDLPFLASVYPGFSYAALKGRNNYMCTNALGANSRGNPGLRTLLGQLQARMRSLGDGERENIEEFLRRPLDDFEWRSMAGSAKGCADFKCVPEECFSARAREIAAQSDLVITNHSILRVDTDMREGGPEGFLGAVTYLVVDEAHTLEDVLINGWTDEYTEWEINEVATKLLKGTTAGRHVVSSPNIDKIASDTVDLVRSYMDGWINFYHLALPGTQEWSRYEETLKQVNVNTNGNPDLKAAMDHHEVIGSATLDTALANLGVLADFYKEVMKNSESGLSKVQIRNVIRSRSAASKLADLCVVMRAAMDTRDGIVNNYGVPTVVTLSGIERKDGTISGKISVVPLDISDKASMIWKGRKTVLMSATLQDLPQGGFRYLKSSLGVPEANELIVDAPFKYSEVQKTYVTKGVGNVVDVPGARFGIQEMRRLIDAAGGRTLVLFTANAELEHAYQELKNMNLPYTLLVQDGFTTKRQLTDQFREDVSSVLLATKSFFTGNDFQGETLSQVILAKYPIIQWRPVTQARTRWWRKRGFPNWYNEQSMNVFRQAAGRLIRSETCKGVISLLDNRVADSRSNVYNVAMQSISALGSPTTSSISDVEDFLA